jgi:class 3 adenylate cyclase/predicted ATPase
MDIAAWLRNLGLERYEPVFRENEIDWEVLPEVTEGDLEKLDLPLGPRKKLLKAIADLASGATTAAGELAAARARGAVRRHAERRQLTVMFVDLVGSTALSAKLDPEDMSAVMRAYQESCAEVVRRWDGHVAKYMGDGVLAYFGWPQAHEDDAERAVRAGLELAAAVGRLKPGDDTPLAARVGIATGLVMVGELIGEGAAQEEAVVGDTPNLAARLQALAEPGAVVVAASTRHLLGGLFVLTDLGPMRLKGFAEPLAAFRVEGEGRAEGRFEALHGQRLTPLVGREQELAILLERWARAKDGDGQVVLLAGEPGIGKSRLIQTLRERLGTQTYTRLSYVCSPYHQTSALHPVIGQIERAAGFGPDDAPEQRLDKLEILLRQATPDIMEAAPLIAAMLSIPTGTCYPPLNLTPQRQKEKTLEALVGQLAGLAAQRPVLMVFEDAHWIDPTSRELLELTVERLKGLPVLLVVTFRPEFTPPWTGAAHITSLALDRLSRELGAALVEGFTDGKPLPAEILDRILARADGIPLFVEELTKTVLEAGFLRETENGYALSGPLPPLAIPSTLQDSLMARLDRSASAKEVAQIGAAIGREFSPGLLAGVALLPEGRLRAGLADLVDAELVFRRGTPPDAIYSFKHALVQDAAYESLLRSTRQKLHGRIAEVLERNFPAVVESQPEVVARHWTVAARVDKAVHYWQLAGERAVRRAANFEAIEHFHKALDLLETQHNGQERSAIELGLLTRLGSALMLVKGWGAPEVEAVYIRARRISKQLVRSAELAPALVGQWLFHHSRAEFAAAREVTAEMLELARELGDSDLQLQAHHAAWPTPMCLGLLGEAREHIEAGLSLYDEERHHHHRFVYLGHDPAVCAHALGALITWTQGYPDSAEQHVSAAIGLARRSGHAPTLAHALWFCGQLMVARRDVARALAMAEELLMLASEHRLALPRATAVMFRGWALASEGQVEEGVRDLEAGIETWRRSGATFNLPHRLGLLAEARARASEQTGALEVLNRALALVEGTGERWFEPYLHLSKGELLLSGPAADNSAAETCFRTAIEAARRQEARLWELRATAALAGLWGSQGERRKAHDLLAPIHGWFTEGLDTPDLQEAKALLDALG